MSFHVYFGFSSGIAKPLYCPKGTLAGILRHVASVESTLGLKVTQYKDNPPHWDHWDEEYRNDFPSVSDEVLCKTAEEHNAWVRGLYAGFKKWQQRPRKKDDKAKRCEVITPADAAKFWHGLQVLDVPAHRWTKEYYRARMDAIYRALRGYSHEHTDGMTLDECYGETPLTPRQCAAVIRFFAEYLDPADLRLDVPVDRDYLASSHYGEYDWCPEHGPIDQEDVPAHRNATYKGKLCELARELRAEDFA